MAVRPLSQLDLKEISTAAADAFESLRGARLFITGGTGFFGHWLLESLLHANEARDLQIRVTLLTRNAARFVGRSPHITTRAAVTLLEGDVRTFPFPNGEHTHVVHAATDSSGVEPSASLELSESILDGTRRVLQFAQATGAKRFLYTSTGAVYGRSTTLPHTPETYLGAPDSLLLQSGYEEAKRMAENLCVSYSHNTTLEPVIARCFAFVGPHLPLDQHFAIGNFIQAGLLNRPIRILGDGTPRRSWLYMSDLAVWLWTLLVRGKANRAYNVGSDEDYTIHAAAALVASTLRPNGAGSTSLPITVAQTAAPNAPQNNYVPSVERARDELGLGVSVPLREAIRRTASWHGYES